jgi:malonate transporter and related proteins
LIYLQSNAADILRGFEKGWARKAGDVMEIIKILFPVFAIVSLGFVIVRLNVVSAGDIHGVSRLVFNILIPILLFNSLSKVELPQEFKWRFFLAYYLVVLAIYGLAMWTSRRFFAYSHEEQGVFGMGSTYSNLVLVGLPIISAGFGEEALLPLFMIISIHSAVQFFIVTLVVEGDTSGSRSAPQIAMDTLRRLARNPIIIGLVLGLLVNLLRVPVPPMVDETLGLIGRATLPCALLVLGGSLNEYKVAGHFAEAGTMIGLKMVLMPALVWILAFVVFRVDALWGAVAVMAAGMPVGVNAYMTAQKYQVGIATISTAFLISTLLAGVNQSLLLALFL